MRLNEQNSAMHLDFTKKKVPTRNGYGDALVRLGKNRRYMVLCADLTDSTRVKKFKEMFPQQFLEIGVAEQNLVTVASGLAHVGKVPFVSSYTAFCPGRCWEQIRTTICYNNNNVKIIGAHAGISVGPDGATHQALEDIATMRSLPNMIVIVPADYEQTKKATMAIAKFKGPAYMRFARNDTEQMTTVRTPFEIGKAQVFKRGKDVVIVGAGPLVYESLAAAEILAEQGISAMVVNCHTVKPLDKNTLVAAAKKCGKVITVEEGQTYGGLGGAVAELLSERYPVPIRRVAVQDRYGESGEPEELMKEFGLSREHIVKEVLKLVKK
jgi:transketolase